MRVFLIQGKQGIGKTTLCNLIEKWLLEQGYTFVFDSREKEYPKENWENDFLAVYEKEGKRIILNTWSDNQASVEYLSKKYEEYKPFDTIITAIRPKNVNRNLHISMRRVVTTDDIREDIITIDLDALAEQYITRETFAKDVFEKEFILKFNN